MSGSLSFPPLKNVLIAGGTHGNEYTGAFLARKWIANPEPLQRSTLNAHALFANPQAFQRCKRYIDRDLNRSFNPSGVIGDPDALELYRAKEIQSELTQLCDGGLPDVIFDLHSTTANMGMSLVLTNRDAFNVLLLAHLRSRFEDVNAYLWEEPASRPGFLNSLSRNGFAIEVGPVANGVLSAEWVQKTEALVHACLDFVESWNQSQRPALVGEVPLYVFQKHVDYPRAADGLPAAMIHPSLQNTDFKMLKNGDPVFLDFEGRVETWKGGDVWPVFINEAAYYEKGIAFTTAEKVNISINNLQAPWN